MRKNILRSTDWILLGKDGTLGFLHHRLAIKPQLKEARKRLEREIFLNRNALSS